MTIGHDEYWSGEQRASVEAARDAGVNLALFTGNDMLWKRAGRTAPTDRRHHGARSSVTRKVGRREDRSEPDLDRLVARLRLQPSFRRRPARESTVRAAVRSAVRHRPDPRACSRREDALLAKYRCCDAQRRTDRDTPPGTDTLGYEWDTTPDNGFRPPGEFYLSTTTMNAQDYDTGRNDPRDPPSQPLPRARAAPCFRRRDGSIRVGLMPTPTATGTSDQRMQQATVNLLADMGAQPATLSDRPRGGIAVERYDSSDRRHRFARAGYRRSHWEPSQHQRHGDGRRRRHRRRGRGLARRWRDLAPGRGSRQLDVHRDGRRNKRGSSSHRRQREHTAVSSDSGSRCGHDSPSAPGTLTATATSSTQVEPSRGARQPTTSPSPVTASNAARAPAAATSPRSPHPPAPAPPTPTTVAANTSYSYESVPSTPPATSPLHQHPAQPSPRPTRLLRRRPAR